MRKREHYHCAHAECQHHREKHDRPERTNGYRVNRIRIDDKDEALARLNHFVDFEAGLFGQEAHVGEDDKAGQNASQEVGHGQYERVSQNVVSELVVGRQRDKSTVGQ